MKRPPNSDLKLRVRSYWSSQRLSQRAIVSTIIESCFSLLVRVDRADRDPVCKYCWTHVEYLRVVTALVCSFFFFSSSAFISTTKQSLLVFSSVAFLVCISLGQSLQTATFGHSLLLAQLTFIHQHYFFKFITTRQYSITITTTFYFHSL
jgi:hypothetical protein